AQAVMVERLVVRDEPEVLDRLAALLAVSREELERRIADPRFSPYRPVPVADDVAEEVALFLREHRAEFAGVGVATVAQRSYPHGSLAAHLLGYVGEINDRELAQRREVAGDCFLAVTSRCYRLGSTIGKSGVELMYEADIRGQPGVTKLEVDARGRVLRALDRSEAVPGRDVQLTVDLDIQALAEESLAQGLLAARGAVDREDRRPFKATAGSVVVLDPRDGSVLAMASLPGYSPGDFVNGIRPDVFATLQDPANHFPLNNRVLQGQYAPGSTFKLVTAVAAVRRGLVTPNTTITDEGSYTIPRCRGERCTFRNAGGTAYGRVNLTRSLVVSSDVYYYSLGARLWQEGGERAIQDTAEQFGFGRRSGVGLLGEQAGRVPDTESRRRLHEQSPEAFPEGRWFTGDNVNLAIGQGEMVATPLQLANAYSTFANGGTLYQPRVAARVLGPDGQTVRDEPAVVTGTVELPASQRQPILEGLRGVVNRTEGTAYWAFAGFPFERLSVAGKTGTAQVSRLQDTALFVAFAPVEAPRYAVAVVMEEAGFGGATAAPVARRVLEGIAGQPPGPVRLSPAVE
ncbi:MAG: penicillin-binding protein 2, partial [Acidimicrobiales bacterium]